MKKAISLAKEAGVDVLSFWQGVGLQNGFSKKFQNGFSYAHKVGIFNKDHVDIFFDR